MIMIPMVVAQTIPDPAALEPATVTVGERPVPVYLRGPRGGTPMLALHGGYTDPLIDWADLVAQLDPALRIALPVQRGHAGRPVADDEEISPASLAADATALVRELGWRRPVMAGFSLGARAALLASADGVDAAALVLISPRFAAVEEDDLRWMEKRSRKLWPEWDRPDREPARRAMVRGIVGAGIDLEAWAADIGDTPVLFVRGGRDRRALAGEAERVAALVPRARVVTIEGHGHSVQRTATAEVAGHVNRFLAEVLPR